MAACAALGFTTTSALRAQAPTPLPPPTYFSYQVDSQAKLITAGSPRYPNPFRGGNVDGVVLALFVVTPDGRVDTTTFRVLKSTHRLFTQAVKDFLPAMRFTPAFAYGKPVRQLVQIPFTFSNPATHPPDR